jgi:hypothetical protein
LRPEELAPVRAYVATATTDELIDRVTAFRADQDDVALQLFESELQRRGVGRDAIEARKNELKETLLTRADGSALACAFCDRPAEAEVWAWHRLWGKVPLFPRPMAVCPAHVGGRP